jgi:hypothetical protein
MLLSLRSSAAIARFLIAVVEEQSRGRDLPHHPSARVGLWPRRELRRSQSTQCLEGGGECLFGKKAGGCVTTLSFCYSLFSYVFQLYDKHDHQRMIPGFSFQLQHLNSSTLAFGSCLPWAVLTVSPLRTSLLVRRKSSTTRLPFGMAVMMAGTMTCPIHGEIRFFGQLLTPSTTVLQFQIKPL